MKKLRNRLAGVLRRIPARIRSEVVAVATSFAATFIALAKPALPALLGSPNISTLHAVYASTIAAAIAGAAAAAFPMAVLYTGEELARLGKHVGVTISVATFAADVEQLAKALAPHIHRELVKTATPLAAGATFTGTTAPTVLGEDGPETVTKP